MVKALQDGKQGCHVGKLFLASIFFADDVVLLAPTRSALQRMINDSAAYCHRLGLFFNVKKSHVSHGASKKSNFYDKMVPKSRCK